MATATDLAEIVGDAIALYTIEGAHAAVRAALGPTVALFVAIGLAGLRSCADVGRRPGADANRRLTTALGVAVAAVISVLNVVLIHLTVTG